MITADKSFGTNSASEQRDASVLSVMKIVPTPPFVFNSFDLFLCINRPDHAPGAEMLSFYKGRQRSNEWTKILETSGKSTKTSRL
jgi:hypothetical protein